MPSKNTQANINATMNNRKSPGRPKLSITKGRANTIRKFFGVTDKQIGDEAKRLNITRNQLYESKNNSYLQLKKGKRKNSKEAEDFLKSITADDPETRRTQAITESESRRFKKVANEFKFVTNQTNNLSFAIVGKAGSKMVDAIQVHKNIKVFFQFQLNFHNSDMELFILPTTIASKNINSLMDIKVTIDSVKEELRNRIEVIEARGTGMVFDSINSMVIGLNKNKPLRGGSYVPLDAYLENKKCCINIQNKDDKCLMYCVLYHLHKDEIKGHPERVSHYKKYKDFNWDDIKFPVKLGQMSKIEEMVKHGINVFGYDNKRVFPLRVTPIITEDIINLLLIDNKHFVYVKKLDVLVSPNKRVDNEHVAKKSWVCHNCLHCFYNSTQLIKHRKNGCDVFEPTRTELPKMIKCEDGSFETPTISFKNHARKLKAPVVIYADFETFVQKHDVVHNEMKSSTTKLANLPPCSYGFNVVSDYPELNMGFQMYRGENTVAHFLRKLIDVGDNIRKIIDHEKKMIINEEQENEFNHCKECHICNKAIDDADVKVRDHDHISGHYRGCAHQSCNLNLNNKNYKIPVFFHNLTGFDGHLIIQGLRDMNFSNIKLIAQNFEKYMSISFGDFRFLDSFAFMSSSLDSLTKNLLKDGEHNFKHTLEASLSSEQRKLILRKGVYPYEYINSSDRFEETALPPIETFYSCLSEEGVSDADYEHAQKVWRAFQIRNIGDYHDLYLKTDVLLLSDIFEAFRNTAVTNYELDPANGYFTLPNFAWDAMLKKTQVKLEQLTDVDMYLMCEMGIRGGTSLISHRYAKANNTYMTDYDESKPSSYIMYLDANNLYGEAMIQKLPTGGFEWVDYVDERFIKNYNEESKHGYFVKCDLEYPKELHDLHNNYPLAVESRAVALDELSPYQLNQISTHHERHDVNMKKLIPNLYDRKDYVCHIRNLKYYLSKGLILKNIHSVLQFEHSRWLKPYIDFNTQKRTMSKNEFEKDLYKLMNNAVFGKTMENMRGRVDITLCTDEDKYLRQVAKPQFLESKIFGENLIAIKQVPKKVELNKPIYVGVSVLDLSKLHMYQFHYDYIKPKYGDKSTLLFTDTDSLCYRIETVDMYEEMKSDKHLFDQSDYSMEGHRSQDNTNKKVIGKFKDETCGVPIVEFCGLRSKMYSILLDDHKEKKTGKGIKKSALKRYVKHNDYKRCLFGSGLKDQRQLVSFNNLRSINHEIGLYRYTKIGLSCSNDKQYLLEDGITSLSYGHYKI